MGFIRWAFKSFIQDGQRTKTLMGLIFKVIFGYLIGALVIGVLAAISFVGGFIPILGWIVSIICWIFIVCTIISLLYSIPGYIIMFLAHYKVIK